VLRFRSVTVPAGTQYEVGVREVNLDVGPGDLILLRVGKQPLALPLADAAEGLAAGGVGTVAFAGEDWASMGPARAAACRGRIGRVFRGTAWVSNLDVDENITLRERHHGSRPAADVEDEALKLAREFGLADLPRTRPAWTGRDDLRRAQWVRALLGHPLLLLLEYPEEAAPDGELSAWVSAVEAARRGGAGTVWFTSDDRVWNNPDFASPRRFRLEGEDVIGAGDS
jgi:ABC-type lipoprotein export system ATPase subunit